MSIRFATDSRFGAWITARTDAHYMQAYMRAEDALTIERDKVRALQSALADRGEAVATLHDEVEELQEEVRVLHLALKRVESERDQYAKSWTSEFEAFPAHPSNGGES